MQYNARKFLITVSLCAMLAANPVLATAPSEDESVGDAHTNIYVEATNVGLKDALNDVASGVAGVTYVNRMVNLAGNAAIKAESAAASKVSIEQGPENKNKALVTDDDGTVYPGYVTTDMLANGAVTKDEIAYHAVTTDKIADSAVTAAKIYGVVGEEYEGYVMRSAVSGSVSWGQVGTNGIADGAVTESKIANDAVTESKIADDAVTRDKIADDAVGPDKISGLLGATSDGYVMRNAANASVSWGQVGTNGIADDAVTKDKIADDAVTTDKIAGIDGEEYEGYVMRTDEEGNVSWGQVGTNGIADLAVKTDKIDNFAVTTNKIAELAVKTNKIADRAVTEDKIFGVVGQEYSGYVMRTEEDGSVSWGQVRTNGIADRAVTTDKIDGEAVTTSKIAGLFGDEYSGYVMRTEHNGSVSWGQVRTNGIADYAVTTDKIAHIAVTTETIFPGAVTTETIDNGAVTTDKIAPSAVTREKTEGVVGVVPIKLENSTSYGTFWIE